MGKRRRIFSSPTKKSKHNLITEIEVHEETEEDNTARGRLKGALLEALVESQAEDSDESWEGKPKRRPRRKQNSIDDEKQIQRPSYVLKLFDRSVDLSQFEESSPLYPICRAWITNQPKANYKSMVKKSVEPFMEENTIELPEPEGPPVSKIPELLPIQKQNKESINLNYDEAPPPSREQLLQVHLARWERVRTAWLSQAARVEMRYEATQRILNSINVNAM